MFAEISSLAPWLLTAAALCLLFAQGMMLRRENRKLREQMKERCDLPPLPIKHCMEWMWDFDGIHTILGDLGKPT